MVTETQLTGHTWIDLLAILILTSPGVIAAVSSLRNGKKIETLNGVKKPNRAVKKPPPKNGAHPPDWFKTPDV